MEALAALRLMAEEPQHRLALPKGTRIREFEFHRVLGHGGFGITYLGWNVTLDIPVAIKEYFPADLATRVRNLSVVPQTAEAAPDFQWGLERFLDEARILARFHHPGIVRIHHFFEAHRTAYIAMDYVEGESLSAHFNRKGTLSGKELTGILDPLLDALEVVHEADYLHRDIKPGNIILRAKDGAPVLLDFGAARQAMGARSRSVTSIVTPGYAPIEQYSTRATQGAWTDIYALGGVCYRALTGESPFDATDRMREDPLVPVSVRCPGRASPGFLAAIDASLAVDAPDRPQDIAAWREAMSDGGPAKKGGLPLKRLAAVLGLVALLVGGERYVDHAGRERAALEAQAREQAAQERRRQEEAAREQAALEKQQQEKAATAEERRKQAAQQERAGEQAALEKRQREQAAQERQRREEAAAAEERRRQAARQERAREQAALEEHQQERAARERQRREEAAAEEERQQAAQQEQSREQAALEEQQRERAAAADRQRQTEAFEAEVGRPAHPKGMSKGDTDLHVAARLNLPLLAATLLGQGADVHAANKDGWTPLHVAAKEDASAAAEVLLEQGADVHARNEDGWTALHLAARENASATAALLLRQKAEVNARERLFGWTPLHLAAAKRGASATAEVLLRHEADVKARDKFGWTPLHSAASNNAHETAEALLKGGADVNAEDNHGWGPLYWAARKDALQAAEVLRRYGGREQEE